MVVVGRHGNSYQLRWGNSGTLLERYVPVHRLKVAPRGTSVDGVYVVQHIVDHRPAEAGPEALDIEYLVKSDSTWEPGELLQAGAMDAISDYWSARMPAQQQSSKRPLLPLNCSDSPGSHVESARSKPTHFTRYSCIDLVLYGFD
jgi:hypothetical protein